MIRQLQVTDMMKGHGLQRDRTVFNDYCNLPRCIIGKV